MGEEEYIEAVEGDKGREYSKNEHDFECISDSFIHRFIPLKKHGEYHENQHEEAHPKTNV